MKPEVKISARSPEELAFWINLLGDGVSYRLLRREELYPDQDQPSPDASDEGQARRDRSGEAPE